MLSKLAATNAPLVKDVLDQCDEVLPQLQLPRLLLGKGEPSDVTSTELAQPLLLAHGFAHFQAWERLRPDNDAKQVSCGAGHSLGEYTAFVAAGLLSLRDALKLVHARGEAMKMAASDSSDLAGMASVVKPKQLDIGSWYSLLNRITKSQSVDIAAYNSPTVTVLSGRKEDIDRSVTLIKSDESILTTKARVIAKALPVSAAFHSRYMRSASERLKELVLQTVWQPFETAKFDVVSNVTGKPYKSIEEVQECCVAGLTSPVLWQQSIEYAAQHKVGEFMGMGADIQKLMEKHIKADSTIFV